MQSQGWVHGWHDSSKWPVSQTPTNQNIAMPYYAGNHYRPQFTPRYTCEGTLSPRTPIQNQPFTLCRISGNIKVCAGCRNRYPKSPSPPNDLCIRHQEWREYFDRGSKGAQVQKCRFGNAYYHFNPSCIKLRFPSFDASQLIIPEDLDLRNTHKERLICSFSSDFS